MVVHKGHEMLASVNTPLFRAELPIQRMGNLKQIHIIETGKKSFVTFIIGAAVQHVIVDDLIVVSE